MGSDEEIEARVTAPGTLTFLFADLRDYTAFVERHGDAAAAELIADYRRIVRAELAKTGGGEIKTEGDSFYLVFPSSRLALLCAVGILRSAEGATASRPDRPIRVGIGVHAGEPVAHEGQYVGSAVNLAARLAASAGAGDLLVSDVVRALVRTAGAAPMRERDRVVLKGVDDPPRIFAVEWRDPLRESPPRSVDRAPVATEAAPKDRTLLCPELIGREAELARLDSSLREAISGRGRTLLVSGEAGVGKSALLRTFLEHARDTGALVFAGECLEVEARRAFAPFIEIATAASRQLESAGIEDQVRAQIGELLGLVPAGARTERVSERFGETERYRMHSAFTALFGKLASRHPLLLAVEDVHWADEATLELFPYLARKLRDKPVLLVGTYRSDELHRLHPLHSVLAELTRGRLAQVIDLRRLTTEQVGRFLNVTLRLDRDPTPAFLAAVHERCEGNPFFMEEVLKALVERGDIAYRGDGSWQRTKDVRDIVIPSSIRVAVQERLRLLDDAGQRALQVAAVIGQRFDFELLRTVTGSTEPDLVRHLRQAIDAQLVVEEPGERGEERFAFRHALTRESVAGELLHRERRVVHRQVGEAIEVATASDPAQRVEELVYHFDEAGDRARALRYRDLAASEAMRTYAFARAARHLERAIELAPEKSSELARLHLRLVEACGAVDDYSRAIRAANEGRRVAEAAGDRSAAVQALVWLAVTHSILGDQARAYEHALEAVRVAESLGETPELADACAEISRLAMLNGRHEEAERWGERALSAARATTALGTEAQVLNTLGFDRAIRGAVDEGVGLLRDSLRIGRELHSLFITGRAYVNLCSATFVGISAEAVRPILAEWVAWESQFGWRDSNFWQAVFAFGDGAWEMLARLARESPAEGVFTMLTQLLAALALTAREGPERGRSLVDEARRFGLTSLAVHKFMFSARMAEFDVLAGDLGAALADADIASPRSMAVLDDACLAACGLWAAGRLGDDVARHGIAARMSAAGHGLAAERPGVAFVEGERSAAAGDLAAAATRFAESAALFDEFVSPIEATLARLRCADLLHASGDVEGAKKMFADGLRFWRGVGAAWYLERLAEWGRERGLAGVAF
jgi:class 3 adenylate cyclase/tetratricopeptide (TPR) repeat protein